MPERIQRKRTRGWKMPKNTICVSRPSEWGNPFLVEFYGREWAIELFDRLVNGGELGEAAIYSYRYAEKVTGDPNGLSRHHTHKFIKEQLRGKNLACWCSLDEPCHADVLLEIANE